MDMDVLLGSEQFDLNSDVKFYVYRYICSIIDDQMVISNHVLIRISSFSSADSIDSEVD